MSAAVFRIRIDRRFAGGGVTRAVFDDIFASELLAVAACEGLQCQHDAAGARGVRLYVIDENFSELYCASGDIVTFARLLQQIEAQHRLAGLLASWRPGARAS